MKKTLRMKIMLLLFALVVGMSNVWATDYVKVTSASDLVEGAVYVIAEISDNTTKYLVTGYGSKLTNTTSGFTVSSNTITTSTATPLEFTLGTVTSGNKTYYTLQFIDGDTYYLGYKSSTDFERARSATNTKEQWSITPSSSAYRILNVSSSNRYIGRNSSNIGPYSTSNSYPNCYLFKKNTSGGSTPSITADNVDILYTATEGSITYTLDVQGTTGTVTASVSSGNDWLSKGEGNNSPISVSCTVNPLCCARKATVRLTYTYNNSTQSVYRDVVVTQAANTTSGAAGSDADHPFTVAQARAAIDYNGNVADVYATGIVSGIVTAYNPTYGNISYNISTDGLTTSDQLQAYRGKSFDGENFTSADDIQVGDIVVVKGNLKKYNSTYEFEENNQLVSLLRKSITVSPTSLSLTYVNGNGPDTKQLVITGTDLSNSFSATLTQQGSAFEMTDGVTTGTSLTIPAVGETITIRLKADLENGNYAATLTLSSDEISDDVTVNITGSVTVQTYNITVNQPLAGGTIEANKVSAEANEIVTLTATPTDAYTFNNIAANWSVMNGETPVTVTPVESTNTATFIMPAAAVNVTATFQAKPTYSVTCNSAEHGSVSASPASAWAGQTVTLTPSPVAGYALNTLTATYVDGESVAHNLTITNNTFEMPAYAVSVTATFEEVFSYNVDFESAMSTYTDWVYSNIIAEQTTITGHGGSGKYGKTNGTTTAYIQTKTKIASPGTFVCYISKIGTNTNANSKWKVQYSSNGSTWTTVGGEQNAGEGITEGTWTKIERDLSSQSNVFVRIYYDGTTAIRTIDDISLEYTPTPKYDLFVANNDNLTITAESGSVNVAEGETKELESGKTVTLSATPASGYNFIAWDVYKTSESSTKVEVNDNQFDMPSYAVTVTATCIATRTITYSINGATSSTTHNIGNVISLEDPDSGIPTGYDFVGWTENPANTADGNLITSITLNANKTVYAVFKKSNTITITGDDFGAYDKDGEVEATMQNTKWGRYYVMKNSGIQFHKQDGYFYNKTEFNNLVSLVATRSGSDHVIVKTATSIDDWSSASALSITSSSGYADTYTIPSGHTHVLLTNDGVNATTKYTSFAFVFNVDETRYTQVYTETTTTASGDIYITGKTIIPSGSTLNMNGHKLHNTIAANLIIKDGGQLILDPENTGVKATFKKNITATTSTKDTDNTHWYTISSPVTNTDGGVTITSVENLVYNGVSYNLYRLSTSSNNWESYNPTYHDDFTKLETGRGYLYRNNGMEVSFAGEVVVGKVVGKVTTYSLTTSYNEGFNLIGNPYGHSIYKGKDGAIDSENLNEGFYYLTNEGGWHAGTYETKIMPLMGILVKANTAGTIDITDTKATATAEKYANDELMFTVSNSQYEDVAYAMFKEGNGLTKIDHRNAEIPMLYISQNKENYSIALMSDETQAFNLNFKAMTTGKYTLSYKAKGNFSYLHVIDLLTGEDVDMLLDGEYSFIASPTDSDNRFIVRLGYLPDYSEGNDDIFAYQNGSDIYVSGEGELQVFDVTGRFVMSGRINGATSISADALSKGVYVLRIVGSEIKTQKIVVR